MWLRETVVTDCETIQDLLTLEEIKLWSEKLKFQVQNGEITEHEYGVLTDLLSDRSLYISIKGTKLESTLF